MSRYYVFFLLFLLFTSCSPSVNETEQKVTHVEERSSLSGEQIDPDKLNQENTATSSTKKIKQSEVRDLMGTYVGIDVCLTSEEHDLYTKAMDEIWQVLGEIHWRMSSYSDKGDVYNINHAETDVVGVHKDTYFVLEQAKRFHELSEGAFDITVGPLIVFWKNQSKREEFPLLREVKEVAENVGMKNIVLLENDQVELLNKEVKVSLGGIAKGFAIDEAVRILKENHFSDFLVDAGGDVYVGGRNCDGNMWQIGVRHPQDPTGLYGVVRVSDQAVTTSGDYEQFITIKGQHLSHIINPLTGYPQKGVISATVIAPTALEADALSTSISVLGPKKGIAVIDGLGAGYAGMVLFQNSSKEPIQSFVSQRYNQFTIKK